MVKKNVKGTLALIDAVQSGCATAVQTAVYKLQMGYVSPVEKRLAISQGLPQDAMTALHAASLLYSLATTDTERETYNTIVNVLVNAGALVCSEAVIHGQKVTPLDVCGGRAPEALMSAVKAQALKDKTWIKHFSATRADACRRSGLTEEDYIDVSRGYASLYVIW